MEKLNVGIQELDKLFGAFYLLHAEVTTTINNKTYTKQSNDFYFVLEEDKLNLLFCNDEDQIDWYPIPDDNVVAEISDITEVCIDENNLIVVKCDKFQVEVELGVVRRATNEEIEDFFIRLAFC